MRRRVEAMGLACMLISFGVATAVPSVAVVLGPGLPPGPVSQQSAVRSALDYLTISSFSRSKLIEQLKYEGFSTEDATIAVDSITVD